MRYLLMLEDEQDRTSRFRKAVETIVPEVELKIWKSAFEMIKECEPFLSQTVLISLDHDLYPPAVDSDDWGDGVQVAKFLASLPPVCPVLVHSSNVECARWMIGEFELGGWEYERVAPIGLNWIEEFWLVIVKEHLHPQT